MSKYRNTVYYDFKSRFLAIFSSNYRHRLVLKIPFSDHIFSKISKYRTEKFHFPSTGKYTPPPPIHTQGFRNVTISLPKDVSTSSVNLHQRLLYIFIVSFFLKGIGYMKTYYIIHNNYFINALRDLYQTFYLSKKLHEK